MLAPLGLVARVLYFLLAPLLLIALSRVFPVWAAVANLGLVLLVFFTAPTLRRRAETSRVVRILVGRQLELEEYYRGRPPRPFLYYVLYPLLFPYWLFSPTARREFTLFKGYTIGGMVLVAVLSGIDYARNWAPDIRFGHFLGATIGLVVIQLILVLAVLMPIATSVITYGLKRARGSLILLGLAAALSTAAGIGAAVRMRDKVPVTVRARIHFRTEADPLDAREARVAALGEADIDRARDRLRAFYRPDEARGFQLRVDRWGSILYCPGSRNRPAIWIAKTASGELIENESRLPGEARHLLVR